MKSRYLLVTTHRSFYEFLVLGARSFEAARDQSKSTSYSFDVDSAAFFSELVRPLWTRSIFAGIFILIMIFF
jgi:hypothetical protein